MLEQLDDSEINAMLALNISAPICLTKPSAAAQAGNQRHGVNVGSTYGSIGYPGYASYCATKFALRGFSEALRRSWPTPGSRAVCRPARHPHSMNSPAAQA
jgi:short-subunit dehydrogenase